jgi:hypothetical protein
MLFAFLFSPARATTLVSHTHLTKVANSRIPFGLGLETPAMPAYQRLPFDRAAPELVEGLRAKGRNQVLRRDDG